MKFGTEIYEKMVSEWREAYLNYNSLKTLLKPFNLIAKKYMKIPLPQTISNNPNLLNRFMITNYSQDDIDRLTDFSEKFEYVVQHEIQKVTNFFKIKLLEYLRRFRLIKINITILQSMNFEKDYAKLKGELRNCFHLFYKEIILLSDFYSINHEAARKILKKQKKLYDKLPKKFIAIKIEDIFDENSYLHKNIPKLQKLKQELETLYLENFYNIRTKEKGKAELNKITHGRFTSHLENFLNGMFLGFSTLLGIVIIILGFQGSLDPDNDSNFNFVFHVYRGFALILVYMWLLAWNVYGWSSYSVNYKNIFGFNYHYSTLSEIVKRTSIFTSILMLSVLWYVLIREDEDFARILFIPKDYAPLIPWVLFLAYLFFPNFKYFNGDGRRYLFKMVKNVFLYTFVHVDFTIMWATEQLLSFVIPIRDIEFSVCYYTQKIMTGEDGLYCSYTERLSLILIATAFPLILRISQCLKMMYQKYHCFKLCLELLNAFKYLTTLITVIFSFFFSLDQNSELYFAMWVFFSIISTVYSYFWDIKVDWGFLESSSKHKYLRKQLSYTKPGFYYSTIIMNLFMRFCWILTLSPGIMQIFIRKQSFNFLFGIIEMNRRAIWNFFRIEMEHIANCGEFKVVEDYQLPFENFRYNTDEKKVYGAEYVSVENAISKQEIPEKKIFRRESNQDLDKPLINYYSPGLNFNRTELEKTKKKENSWASHNKKLPVKYSIETIENEVLSFKKSLVKNNGFIVIEDAESSSKDKDRSSNKEENIVFSNSSYEDQKEKVNTRINQIRLRNQQSVAYTRSISPDDKREKKGSLNKELKTISENFGLDPVGQRLPYKNKRI